LSSNRTKNNALAVQFTGQGQELADKLSGMEPSEQLKQQVLKENRLTARLRMAASRVEAAEKERIWAIATAHSTGLSIRKIAAATDLSSSRVHQLLHTDEAYQMPEWLNALTKSDAYVNELLTDEWTPSLTALKQQLADESEVLHWCISWLEKLACGETVIVNLRAESDSKTAFVAFDQARVVRVLKRIAADLDQLSGRRTPTENIDSKVDTTTAGVKHRHRLAEPEPELSSLSQREQRAILREKMGLPPL